MTHSNQTAIRNLVDWSDAVYERDRNRVAANRTEGIVMFKVPEPLQAKDPDAYHGNPDLLLRGQSR